MARAAANAGVSVVSTDGELDVTPALDASGGVVVSAGNVAPLTIPLPDGLSLDTAEKTDSGSTVYSADQGSVDVTVDEVVQGVRVSTVLWDGSQDAFSYTLPEGVDAAPQPDGSLELTRTEVVEAEGITAEVTATIGSIEPAWAVDANGAEVSTAYEVAGGVVTQVVDVENAAFPVVADPTWSLTSPVQVRIRFTRAETATIANGGWGATGLTAVCAAAGAAVAGPPGAAAFAAGCFLATGPMVYTAGVAQNSKPKRCLEQFMTFVPLSGVIVGVPWYGTYACK
ncbi:hypothetical protein KZC51_01955 [Microbacterium sp. SSW1-49]|uniref:Uncharacterized protein n=1 Tax=Microbacterium croceum TaxID=2851645 RepID=A0ABT0FA03_9MICO|nr:hypothetical protein [Microbacterium croceum]MCK2034888.1 hypothetical protein [Microbacterium croceum]